MTNGRENLDLSKLPPEYRAAFEALQGQVGELTEINTRLEALVKELRNTVYGKKSEKLTEDERQLAFEDLEIAVAEVQTAADEAAATPSASRKKRPPPFRRLLRNRLSGKGQSEPRRSAEGSASN